MKYNQGTLSKMEHLFKESGYIVRFEKGNFHSGYCILFDKRVIVVNKFFDTEARINSFFNILPQVEINEESLSEESLLFYNLLKSETAKT
jgi:hypothetical protein